MLLIECRAGAALEIQKAKQERASVTKVAAFLTEGSCDRVPAARGGDDD